MESSITSKKQLLAGRILSGLVVLFMVFDALIKFIKLPEVVQTTVNEPFSGQCSVDKNQLFTLNQCDFHQ